MIGVSSGLEALWPSRAVPGAPGSKGHVTSSGGSGIGVRAGLEPPGQGEGREGRGDEAEEALQRRCFTEHNSEGVTGNNLASSGDLRRQPDRQLWARIQARPNEKQQQLISKSDHANDDRNKRGRLSRATALAGGGGGPPPASWRM